MFASGQSSTSDAQRSSSGRYSVDVSEKKSGIPRAGVGLCADCRFVRRVESDRGSTFYLCERSANDAKFPKYPRLPVLICIGYDPSGSDGKPEGE